MDPCILTLMSHDEVGNSKMDEKDTCCTSPIGSSASDASQFVGVHSAEVREESSQASPRSPQCSNNDMDNNNNNNVFAFSDREKHHDTYEAGAVPRDRNNSVFAVATRSYLHEADKNRDRLELYKRVHNKKSRFSRSDKYTPTLQQRPSYCDIPVFRANNNNNFKSQDNNNKNNNINNNSNNNNANNNTLRLNAIRSAFNGSESERAEKSSFENKTIKEICNTSTCDKTDDKTTTTTATTTNNNNDSPLNDLPSDTHCDNNSPLLANSVTETLPTLSTCVASSPIVLSDSDTTVNPKVPFLKPVVPMLCQNMFSCTTSQSTTRSCSPQSQQSNPLTQFTILPTHNIATCRRSSGSGSYRRISNFLSASISCSQALHNQQQQILRTLLKEQLGETPRFTPRETHGLTPRDILFPSHQTTGAPDESQSHCTYSPRKNYSYLLSGVTAPTRQGSFLDGDDGFEMLNNYTILQEIGRGSHATVLLALDVDADKVFAVKMIRRMEVQPNVKENMSLNNLLSTGDNSPPCSGLDNQTQANTPKDSFLQDSNMYDTQSVGSTAVYTNSNTHVVSSSSSSLSSSTRSSSINSSISINSSVSSNSSNTNNPTRPRSLIVTRSTVTMTESVDKEIAIMRLLKHPNIVSLHEVIEDEEDNVSFFVLDYVHGTPLLTFKNPSTAYSGQKNELSTSSNSSSLLRTMEDTGHPCPGLIDVLPHDNPDFGSDAFIFGDRRLCSGSSECSPQRSIQCNTTDSTNDNDVIDHAEDDGDGYLKLYDLSYRMTCDPIRPLSRLKVIVKQIVHAVYYLHVFKHIVHRDIKPNNIILETNTDKPYLLDFGCADHFSPSHHLLSPMPIPAGTPAFFAPEICNGEESGPAADIWSLGVTIYCCVFGTVPFAGTSVREVVDSVTNGSLAFPVTKVDVEKVPETTVTENPLQPGQETADEYNNTDNNKQNENFTPNSKSPKNSYDDPMNAPDVMKQWKHLLYWMLRKDPNDRPSIRRVLNHAVFREEQEMHGK